MTQQAGKAERGSQFWLQTLVNEQPALLDGAIKEAAPSLADQTIQWLSPLASDGYREYQDTAFLDRLGIQLAKRPLDRFWPKGGPVWDGLARSENGDILLVEAKSHIPEAVSPPTMAKAPASLQLIQASLEEAKRYLNGRREPDWAGTFYQMTNRLAHLYLLRVLNEVPAHLVFVYFVGDREMGGPESIDEWRGAIRTIEIFLGVERTKLTPFIHHVFPDVRAAEGTRLRAVRAQMAEGAGDIEAGRFETLGSEGEAGRFFRDLKRGGE
jgi:hypothetical protein